MTDDNEAFGLFALGGMVLMGIVIVLALVLSPSPMEQCGRACSAGGGQVRSFIGRDCLCEPAAAAFYPLDELAWQFRHDANEAALESQEGP